MKQILLTLMAALTFVSSCQHAPATLDNPQAHLSDLKNYQVNSPNMVSSGLPSQQHFKALKTMGVSTVIDLLPGDRSEESNLMSTLNLEYHNIQVDWENPTLANFTDYVLFMQQSANSDGITLTHCKLNWRGAVFTYLYRVTHLKESEASASGDMLAIWQPNDTWQQFISDVNAHYKQK